METCFELADKFDYECDVNLRLSDMSKEVFGDYDDADGDDLLEEFQCFMTESKIYKEIDSNFEKIAISIRRDYIENQFLASLQDKAKSFETDNQLIRTIGDFSNEEE